MGKSTQTNVLDPSCFFSIKKIKIPPSASLPKRSDSKSKYRLVDNTTETIVYHSSISRTIDEEEGDEDDEDGKNYEYNLEGEESLSKFWDHVSKHDPRLKTNTFSHGELMVVGTGYISSFSSPVGDVAVNVGERIASDYGASTGSNCHPLTPR